MLHLLNTQAVNDASCTSNLHLRHDPTASETAIANMFVIRALSRGSVAINLDVQSRTFLALNENHFLGQLFSGYFVCVCVSV